MYNFKFQGFTLAEVLITLGIIGVVAAITFPSLITNYKKAEATSKLRAAYSIFSQAVKLSVEDNGEVASWDLDSYKEGGGDWKDMPNAGNLADHYIVPYMTGITKISKDKWKIRTLSGYKNNGNDYYFWWGRNIYYMQNGMAFVVAMPYNTGGYPVITVDVNGRRPPNIMGIDTFSFLIDPQTSNVVMAGYQYSKEELLGNGTLKDSMLCEKDNSWTYYRGGYCGAVIEKDGWKISKDYPWINGI